MHRQCAACVCKCICCS